MICIPRRLPHHSTSPSGAETMPCSSLYPERLVWYLSLLKTFTTDSAMQNRRAMCLFPTPSYVRAHFPCCWESWVFTRMSLAQSVVTSQSNALCSFSEMPQLKRGSPSDKYFQNFYKLLWRYRNKDLPASLEPSSTRFQAVAKRQEFRVWSLCFWWEYLCGRLLPFHLFPPWAQSLFRWKGDIASLFFLLQVSHCLYLKTTTTKLPEIQRKSLKGGYYEESL